MRIVYIIGNGFDLSLGLKTKYSDFYNYLNQKKEECSSQLKELLKEVKSDCELWSKMEIAFGLYTKNLKTVQELKDLYGELNVYFNEYLLKEEARFKPNWKMRYKCVSDILQPDKYLNDSERQTFRAFVGDDDLRYRKTVISLNYTRTFEQLINVKSPVVQAAFNIRAFGKPKIIHVHGELNQDIVLGVNDIEQIANEEFRNDQLAKEILIKEQSNQCMGYTRHSDCERLIKKANLIVLHGTSLGETDQRWWNLIGQQLTKRKFFCIFYFFRIEHDIKLKQFIAEEKRKEKESIMKKLGFNDPATYPDDLDQRLYIIPNAKLFV
ncbi:MAG: bacteriophage abortive infection AbiH family protein [Muribaculaceae bacterium]|nr:bacteriophage abortive infection AbiH family protein [Muribaculaceae bacterium]